MKIIHDEKALLTFIEWLPDLEEGECFYLSLFARKKYHPSAMNDKALCKRTTASSKEWLLTKIRQMEVETNCYVNKNGTPIHEDALALYIMPNPRSFKQAQKYMIKKLADTLCDDRQIMNPAAMALSCIQKAKSRTCYIDFDIDTEENVDIRQGTINRDAASVLETRGGYHLLVDPNKVLDCYKKSWYNSLKSLPGCDVSGDNLIPVPGCRQGNFTPEMFY